MMSKNKHTTDSPAIDKFYLDLMVSGEYIMLDEGDTRIYYPRTSSQISFKLLQEEKL